MKIITWNVNGLRAVLKKGLLDWLAEEKPDLLCLQEIKAQPGQVDEGLLTALGYTIYWQSAQRKGYSGVATLVKEQPDCVSHGIGNPKYDIEGRTLSAFYPQFVLVNVYVPSGSRDAGRLDYKLAFYADFLGYCESLRAQGYPLILCGDFNTAHREIDLANPKTNQKTSGFLPQERAWIERYITRGYRDVFRDFHREGGQYSWWTYRSGARARNIGWRLDYFLVTDDVQVEDCYILTDVMGSDHCPVVLVL